MAKSIEKRYRIIKSFIYKGEDGKAKQKEWVTVGPGERIPELDSNEIARLIHFNNICKIDSHGENIPNMNKTKMNNEEVDRLFEGKHPDVIMKMIAGGNFDDDTLAIMLVYSEKKQFRNVASYIEQKM